jgi:hypothetical protein
MNPSKTASKRRSAPARSIARLARSIGSFLVTTFAGCGTIEAVSVRHDERAFPGVRHDLSTMAFPLLEHGIPEDDPDAAACAAACFGVPAAVHGACKLADLPLSFVADLGVMSCRRSQREPALAEPPKPRTMTPADSREPELPDGIRRH